MPETATATLTAGPIQLDHAAHEVRVHGVEIHVPLREFQLLAVLLREAGRVITRRDLIREVWGEDYVGDTRTLDVHVRRLRERLEDDPHNPVWITTIRGVGYKIRVRP